MCLKALPNSADTLTWAGLGPLYARFFKLCLIAFVSVQLAHNAHNKEDFECTKWEHRALYNNTNNTQTHMHTLMPVSAALTTFASGEMARCVPVLNACWPDFAFVCYIWWGFSSVLTDKPGAILTPVQVPCAAWDFSPSQLSVQTRLQCPYSPHVHSHASASEWTLKSPTPLFGHTKIQHTWIGMANTALATAVPYLSKVTWISCKG